MDIGVGLFVVVVIVRVLFICSLMMMLMVMIVVMMGNIDRLMDLSIVRIVGILINIINCVVDTGDILGNGSKGTNSLTEIEQCVPFMI